VDSSVGTKTVGGAVRRGAEILVGGVSYVGEGFTVAVTVGGTSVAVAGGSVGPGVGLENCAETGAKVGTVVGWRVGVASAVTARGGAPMASRQASSRPSMSNP
jgi:hypothetical protein